MRKFLFWSIWSFVLLSSMYSCRDENFFEGTEALIRLSEDTIRFDTVFTTVGTTTKLFKIYNEEDASILIPEIKLVNSSGFFRLNVDGIAANSRKDVEIPAKDSIYVFVEATIDPNLPLNVSPYIIEDKVEIIFESKVTPVYLEAWGQDANYVPDKFGSSKLSFLSCDFGEAVWNDPKPYVIYGSLFIDSCTLVLPPGTRVYVHGGIAINEFGIYNDGLLYFLPNGKMVSEGTADQPVTILTDRLEEEYIEDGNQWSGIIFSTGSTGNRLTHTKIRNSIVGARVDSLASASFYNCEFGFTSGTGLIGRHANIYAENCLMHNNLISGIQLVLGGDYEFNHCTVYNESNQDEALLMTNFQCLDQLCIDPPLVNDLNAVFRNCLFVGNDSDEIALGQIGLEGFEARFDYDFLNCFVQVDELLDEDNHPNFFDNCENCVNNPLRDSMFMNEFEFDFRLDTMSVAIDAGFNLPFVQTDKDGLPRDDEKSDVGCYEFQK